MQKLKQLNKTTIRLTKPGHKPLVYKGYPIGELPPTFAFLYNQEKETTGVESWFNYKGLTYINL
jgi:hypothetical protein|tara:strand:+ start:241 stop:432 length:192 start_codon:yes stop_codon:yes gene_type:complete